MADSTLTTTTSSTGAQTAGSPDLQAPNNANNVSGGTPSTIQPVVSGAQLDSHDGVPLTQTSLASSSVPLTSSTTASTAPVPVAKHINGGLLFVAIVLFVAAVGMFWFSGRADKNTTI